MAPAAPDLGFNAGNEQACDSGSRRRSPIYPAAAISLNVWPYWTRCEASTGWLELIVTGPPMVPAGNVTTTSTPEPTLTVIGVAPCTPTVTLSLVVPGF